MREIDPFANFTKSRNGLFVPADVKRWRYRHPVAIDLFSGCGGFSLGFMKAGFQVVAAVEYDHWAAMTYMHNLGAYPINIHFDTDESKGRLEKALEKEFERWESPKSDAMSIPLAGVRLVDSGSKQRYVFVLAPANSLEYKAWRGVLPAHVVELAEDEALNMLQPRLLADLSPDLPPIEWTRLVEGRFS